MSPPYGTYFGNNRTILPAGQDYWSGLVAQQSGLTPSADSVWASGGFGMTPMASAQSCFDMSAVPSGQGIYNNVLNNPVFLNLFMQCFATQNIKTDNRGYEGYDAKKGELLKQSALEAVKRCKSEADARGEENIGKCARGVRYALEEALFGHKIDGNNACDWADRLAKDTGRFKEVTVSGDDLKKLPSGAIVVWDAIAGADEKNGKFGHISIASGDGREISDHEEAQRTQYRGSSKCRVFIPV